MSTRSRIAFSLWLLLPAIALLCSAQLNANIVDLTARGNSGSVTAGVDFFQQIDPRATGTGLIDPFLRMQASNDPIEQGFNTDAQQVPLDDLSGQFTHSIKLSDIPVVTLNGTEYLQFMLDINQTKNVDPSLLSLSEVKIFTAATGDINAYTADVSGTDANEFSLTGGTKVYDMNGSGDFTTNRVELNYSLNTGSGSGDMFMYVAKSLFPATDTYVYLYSLFGQPNSNNDGFEEWALDKGAPVVPEPSSVILLGTMLAGVGLWLRRRLETQA